MDAEIKAVADEVKREITRFGDDTKAKYENLQSELKSLRDMVEGKGDEGGIKKAVEAMSLKYEHLEANERKATAALNARLDGVLTAINRSRRGQGLSEIPKGLDLQAQALEFKRAGMGVRNEPLRPEMNIEVTQKDLDHLELYKTAFPRYLRMADARMMADEEYKALTTGNDPGLGYLVTPAVSSRIMEVVYETSPLAQLAYVETIGSDKLEIPSDEGRGSGGWVGEEETRPETGTPSVGGQTIPVHEMYASPKITQRLLEDASINVEEWLARKNAEEFSRMEATAFILGNGIRKPRGILSYPFSTNPGSRAGQGNIQYFPGGGASAYTADKIKGLPLLALKERYHGNARWLMKRSTLAAISILRDDSGATAGTGQYLWQPGLSSGAVGSQLAGYPVSLADDMPAVASNAYSIIFGDLRQAYTVVRRMGITTLRDPFTAKPYVMFYSRMRVGGDVTNFEAFVALKVSTS